MTNKEKFLALVSGKDDSILKGIEYRRKNRLKIKASQQIALKVLERLDELHWTQKKLAGKMGVSPQQISKIVRGTENLTLETQVKLESILDIQILASSVEQKIEEIVISFNNQSEFSYPVFNSSEEGEAISTQKVETTYSVKNKYTSYLVAA